MIKKKKKGRSKDECPKSNIQFPMMKGKNL
jgi:hypothetical protein